MAKVKPQISTQTAASNNKIQLPKSVSSFTLNSFCLLFFSVIFYWLFMVQAANFDALNLILLIILCTLPLMMYDMTRKDISGIIKRQNKFSLLRLATKICGLVLTYYFLEFFVWVFPRLGAPFLTQTKQFLSDAIPYLMAASLVYVVITDLFMPKPKDAYWHLGNLIIRQQKPDYRMIAEHFKAWLIKFFFFSIMSLSFYSNIKYFTGWSTERFLNTDNWKDGFDVAFSDLHRIAYTIDLYYAAIGYVLTFKIFGSNIRSTEPTTLGWLVCMICYPPFWPFLRSSFFSYDDETNWRNYFEDNMPIYVVWGSAILICDFIYAFATVAFGYRFSNLTYRGIITGGPYRFTKHPAYVFKNLSWWMVSLPFISYGGPIAALHACLLLGCINIIYYLRARTEENHLSNYPEYVQYAEVMNKRSIFRHVAMLLPFLKYSHERALKSNSRVYKPFAEQL